jgi:protoporphyrinogen oxidase
MTTTLNNSKAAIIGGGIGGLTIAYRLAQAGVQVTVYEQGSFLGGLASSMFYKEQRMDRFYHTILSSDMSMQTLIEDTGVKDKLHFVETKQGFYDQGKLYPFNTPVDFMLFPPLNIFQRFRLALQIVLAQFEKNIEKMDNMPVKKWLVRTGGEGVYNKVWMPLLRSKFDTETVDVPATYIWSRLKRMMATRQGATSKEMMCYLEGSYYQLIEAIANECEKLGVEIKLNTKVEEIVIQENRVTGLRVDGEFVAYDAVASTLQSPITGQLIPNAPTAFRDLLLGQQYLGILCPVMLLKKRLTPYYVLNITDDTIPFTAVVETTTLIDPKYVGGYNLVYLPKYLAPDSEILGWDEEKVRTEWLAHFKRMFPDFQESDMEAFIVQRARYVEPLRPIGTTDQIPPIKAPVDGLYLSNSAMVYPDLNNGESVTRLASRTVDAMLNDLRSTQPTPTQNIEQIPL